MFPFMSMCIWSKWSISFIHLILKSMSQNVLTHLISAQLYLWACSFMWGSTDGKSIIGSLNCNNSKVHKTVCDWLPYKLVVTVLCIYFIVTDNITPFMRSDVQQERTFQNQVWSFARPCYLLDDRHVLTEDVWTNWRGWSFSCGTWLMHTITEGTVETKSRLESQLDKDDASWLPFLFKSWFYDVIVSRFLLLISWTNQTLSRFFSSHEIWLKFVTRLDGNTAEETVDAKF